MKSKDLQIQYDNWRRPNLEEIKLEWKLKQDKPEYCRRFKKLGTTMFDSWENFKSAIDNGKVIRLSLDHDMNIERRSFTSSLKELTSLLATYNTAHMRKGMPERILQGFKDGDAIPMPLILHIKGVEYIIAGNTRLDVARIVNITPDPKVIIVR